MKTIVARWCASLIADEWPIPDKLRQWLRTRQCVSDALRDCTALEDHLRASAGATFPSRKVDVFEPARRDPALRRTFLAAPLALVATLLVVFGTWALRDQTLPSEDKVVPLANAIDQEPVLVSLASGRVVMSRLYSGLENVANDFAGAGSRLTSPLLPQKQIDEANSIEESPENAPLLP